MTYEQEQEKKEQEIVRALIAGVVLHGLLARGSSPDNADSLANRSVRIADQLMNRLKVTK